MKEIQIDVVNKRATVVGTPVIVCDNTGYTIIFNFDEEWAAATVKTARFAYVRDGRLLHEDVVFGDSTVEVPGLYNIRLVMVGVYAGDLCTTTAAEIPCEQSIRSGTSVPAEPTKSQYDQLVALVNSGIFNGDGGMIPPTRGGTGLTGLPANNFLVGSGSAAMVTKTPEEVLELIGGANPEQLEAALQEVELLFQQLQASLPKFVKLDATGTLYNTNTVTVANANGYAFYLVVIATEGNSGAKVSAWIPADMVAPSAAESVLWSVGDANSYKRFTAHFDGVSLVLTAKSTSGSGVENVTPAVYGLDIGNGMNEGITA